MLLETVTYIATTETVTCTITIEIVMCILHCRKYYLHDWQQRLTCIFSIKVVTHIVAEETFTCIIATKT